MFTVKLVQNMLTQCVVKIQIYLILQHVVHVATICPFDG